MTKEKSQSPVRDEISINQDKTHARMLSIASWFATSEGKNDGDQSVRDAVAHILQLLDDGHRMGPDAAKHLSEMEVKVARMEREREKLESCINQHRRTNAATQEDATRRLEQAHRNHVAEIDLMEARIDELQQDHADELVRIAAKHMPPDREPFVDAILEELDRDTARFSWIASWCGSGVQTSVDGVTVVIRRKRNRWIISVDSVKARLRAGEGTEVISRVWTAAREMIALRALQRLQRHGDEPEQRVEIEYDGNKYRRVWYDQYAMYLVHQTEENAK